MKSKRLWLRVLIALLVAALFCVVVRLGWLDAMDGTVSDALYQHERPTDGEVLVIGMDQRSVDAFGPMPWPRDIMADVIGILNSDPDNMPAVIGIDVLYVGGSAENIIMRLMDIWSAIPGQLLTIIIATAFGPGFWQTLLAMSIGGVPMGVRQTRAQFLKERGREYVEAAEVINCSKLSIMMRHIFPNACAPLIVSTTMGIGGTVTSAAGLAYIGLGVQPPTPEWGTILNDGKTYITKYPHLLWWPGVFIAILVLSVNLLGDGLRDALDPKLRD